MTNLKSIHIIFIVSTLLACFSAQCHSQETVSINFSQTGGPLVRLNQAVSKTQTSSGPQDDQLVKNLGMRLERTFWSPAAWAQAGPGKYNFTAANPFSGAAPAPGRDWGSDSPVLDNIIAQGAQPVICFTGEPGWDASAETQTAELNGLPVNMNEYQQLLKDGLNHLRSKYPGIQYIEVWNEPDNSLTPAQYDTLYQNVSEAVQAVNAALPSGERPFLVGGPAVYNPGSSTIGNFISFVRANNLQLDFLSWHEYGGDIRSDAETLQNKLSSAGLDPNLPQFVTEWGYTSYNTTSIPTPSQLMVAATYISRGWTELETNNLGGIVTTFPSSEAEYGNYSRSMFVPYPENPSDGQVFPLYNVYQMMSMQKSTLVANSGVTGGTSSLSPLATEDGSGVALMLTNTAGSTVSVNLNNLPSTFQQGAFQFREYQVDTTHSNWAHNQATSTLQEVVNSTENAATSFSTTLNMGQNSVAMLILTPTAIVASDQAGVDSNQASVASNQASVDSNPRSFVTGQSSTGGGTSQTVINYPSGFAGSSGQLWLENGTTLSGSAIQLTNSTSQSANNAWYKTPVNVQAFTTTFTWNAICPASPATCGDGMGFMIISDPNSTPAGYTYSGFSGGQFSWSQCTTPPAGCASINSILVKFDLVDNQAGTFGANLTGFYSAGEWPQYPNPSYDMSGSGINMQSGHLMSATLTYDGATLTETVTDTATGATYTKTYSGVNIPSLVAGNTAYVGFGGGSGAALVTQDIRSWTYTVNSSGQTAAPTFSPAAGTYTSAQSVTLSDATSGATIYYTTNGTTPTSSSTKYTGPITVSSTETLQAIAVATGGTSSTVTSAAYTMTSLSSVSTPTFSPAAGTYTSAQSVTLSDATSGATIYYTTNGTTPTSSSTKYTGPITVSSTETLQAIAVATDFTNSAVMSAAYTITSPTSVASQTVINYPSGFAGATSSASGGSGPIWLEGCANLSGSTIVLSSLTAHSACNAWVKIPANVQAFTTTFTFNFICPSAGSGTPCADGMGFMIISDPNPDNPGYTYSGFSGSQFSWSQGCNGSTGTSGCLSINGILVKFDLANNETTSYGANLTGFYSGGEWANYPNPQYDMAPSGINMESGDLFTCTLTYNDSTLTETLTDTVTRATYTKTYTGVNIPSLVAGNTAFIGFGAGTGAGQVQTNLQSWTYTVE